MRNLSLPIASMIACFALATPCAIGQISPGPLSKAHASLDGPTHCTSCHDLAKRPPEYKCVECHQEIRTRLDEHRGLHPSLVGSDRTGRSCATCHSDHNGKDFAVVHWDGPIAKFDHHRAGYTLEGKHATLACKACHQPSRIKPAEAAKLQVKDLTRTYLGLSPKCIGCHVDEHHGQLSADCERCHNSTRWQDAAQFNHEKARFTLTGAHIKVVCQKCHLKIVDDPKPYIKYKEIDFKDCTPCHKDPHKGAFKQSCHQCHSTQDWKPIQISAVFNHSTTKYPLEGKHQSVACKSCHPNSNFKTPVAFAKCMDCHKKDYHLGQFAQHADHGECGTCHKVEGFKPSTFTAARHTTTKFPLVDKHAAVACAKCHIPHEAETVFVFKSDACLVCHADVHKGQFAEAPHENKCESCHNVRGFSPSTFTLTRHQKSRFPLLGAHFAVLCSDCHKVRKDAAPPPPVKYHFERRDCVECHTDPHRGEFTERMTVVKPDGSLKGCEVCHTTREWKEITGFDHDTTSFALVGAHRAVTCEGCHKSSNLRPGLKDVSFKSAPKVCSGCHEDAHGGQFSKTAGPPDCTQCHKVIKWKPSTFDHETGSTFHLAGAHKNVPCAQCHRSTKEISGKMVVMYKPTARECIACHGIQASGK